MTSLRRRLERLECSIAPAEIDLLHLISAGCWAPYAEWLEDEVGAGRMRHGTLCRLILEAGGRYTATEIADYLAKANAPAANPKPYRPPPDVPADACVPHGYPSGSSTPPTAVASDQPGRAETGPVQSRAPAADLTQPAAVVSFVRSTESGDGLEFSPWEGRA